MNSLIRPFIILAASFFVMGCQTEIARFPFLTTKSAQIDHINLKSVPLQRNVSGDDDRLWFLFFPLGGSPTIETAVDNCLKEGEGDFIMSAKISEKSWSVLLFSGGGYIVEGDVCDSLGQLKAELPLKSLITNVTVN